MLLRRTTTERRRQLPLHRTEIGKGAYVGSCSVITKDVAAHSLAVERSTQETLDGWAASFRVMMAKRKAPKGWG